MALFQTGSGYRDATKALTIKALQERQKALQDSTASMQGDMSAVTSDPLSAVGHVANIFSGAMQSRRAAGQEADSRAQLAGIMAGIDPEKGASMEQIAAMQQLDPEFANAEYARAMEARTAAAKQEDQQAFTAGESVLSRQAEAERQAALLGHQTTQQEDQQKAAVDLSKLGAQQDITKLGAQDEIADVNAAEAARVAQEEAIRKEKAVAAENQRQEGVRTPDAEIHAAYEAGNLGGPPGSPEAIAGRDAALAKAHSSSNTYINGQEKSFDQTSGTKAAERIDDYIKQGASSKDFISQVRTVAELGKSVGTGKWAEVWNAAGPYVEALGIDVTGLGESQAFKAISDRLAPNMRPAGSGSTSNFDAQQFLNSLQKIGNDPKANQIIEFTFEALSQNKMQAAEIASKVYNPSEINPATGQQWTWYEAEAAIRALPNPYDTFKKYMGDSLAPAPTDTGDAVPPPADTGSGAWTIKEKGAP